ncbi:adaptin N terminal region-domain-containing protein [Mycena galopus ATCC 62051]|nr:adaptin N terminal region-domain-containing protein [Mycena galopus ATCC 62051]
MSSIPATRQAIGIQKTGDFDVLELLTLPLTVDGGDIVVKAEWLGVNFIDTYFRKGLYPLKELPGAIGAEMSGTILALPTDETVLEDPEYKKRGFTVGAKVAVGGASVIGIHSNVASAPWKKGETILVHTVAGGLGLLFAQLIKARGATVIGTTSIKEKAELAKAHGADHVILYKDEDTVQRVLELTNGVGVDAVFDGVGKDTFDSDFKMLKRKGTLVSVGNASGAVPPFAPIRLVEKNLKLVRPTFTRYYVGTNITGSHSGSAANKKDESKFIAKAVDEIRKEIKGDDMELKAGAVLKLTYLDMLGYDMSWASFHVVEVMSSPKFHLKSVGYLAAVQSFDQETDVLMLTTNLLKKDMISTPAEISVALNGLSHIVMPDLARDLSPELITMLTHSRAQIRKRAILALYKVMVKYPEVLQQGVAKLKDKLDDPDPGVVGSTVNLFHLLTTSTNNWMLIKIVKLFGSLSPYEPRLVRKLQPPITELISTTPAISLLYECVHTCIIGGMLEGSSGDSLAKMCVSKLAAFILDTDQNLKYIALLALVKIVPSHPHLVAEYQDTILASVNDQDVSIRMRALDLVSAMVSPNSLQSIVQQVLSHLVPDTSSSTLATAAQSLAQHTVLDRPPPQNLTSPRSMYENVTNFEWYLSVLVDLAHVANVDIGAGIRDQLVDVVGRVKGVRRYAVKLMYTLLCDDTMLHNARDEGSCSEVLWAAAWICGEYCSELSEPQKLLPYLLQAEIATLLPEIIAVYIHAASKIFGHWAAQIAERWDDDDLPEVKSMVDLILDHVREFVGNSDVEVQERAVNTVQLFTFIQADLNAYRPKPINNPFAEASSSFDPIAGEPRFPKSLYLLQPLHEAYELNPVALAAQASVPIPYGLDLDACSEIKKGKGKEVNGGKAKNGKKKHKEEENGVVLVPVDHEEETETAEDRERRLAERRERLRDDPYYIIDDKPSTSKRVDDDIDSIPVVRLDDMPSLADVDDSRIPSLKDDYTPPSSYVIDRDGEMPDGAVVPSLVPLPVTPGTMTPLSRTGTPIISSFPQYEVEDEVRTSTPEPIKVTRTKKKTPGKKKRTQDSSTLPDSSNP